MTEIVKNLNLQTKIKLSLILILVVTVFSLLLAQKASPDAPLFFGLKRLQEKIFLKLKPAPASQVEYIAALLDNRLSELTAVVNHKNYGYVLESSLRYSATAGDLTNTVLQNHLNEKMDEVKNKLTEHQNLLRQILASYPEDLNTERRFIVDDVNYLSVYIEQLSKTATASN